MIDIVNGINQYQGSFYNIDNSGLLQARKEAILYDNEQNQIAQKAATELASAIGNLKFHNSMAAEKQKLTSNLDNMIDATLQNYAGNLRYGVNNIMQMSRDLVTDEKIKGLLETNKQYEEWVAAVKENKYIDEDTKEFILNSPDNQYHFDAIVVNNDDTQSVINGWKTGDNNNVIGYKNWQAGREPVTQRNYLEFAVNVLKTLDTNNNQYTVRKFYDANGNELKDAAILNAAYYVDNGNTKVVLTEQKIKDAIENAINSDLSIQASLRQDYDKAKYFRDKGDDRYGVGVGTNSVLSPEGYKNKIFSGFAPTYAIENTVWSTVPSIITEKGDKDGGGDNKKTTPKDIDNWSASVGIIKSTYDPSAEVSKYTTFIDNTNDAFKNLIKTKNIPVNLQNIDDISVRDQINIIKNYRDIINDDKIYSDMIDALTIKMDYQERITLYNQDIFKNLDLEQQAKIKTFEALNNGTYINFEEDSPFIRYYNNFFVNNKGEVLNDNSITFNDTQISTHIQNLATSRKINLRNCGIYYDQSTDTFKINNDPISFKVMSKLTYDVLNDEKGVGGKYLYEIVEHYRDPNNLGVYPSLNTNDGNYTHQLVKLGSLIGFGSAYTKADQEQQDIKRAASIEDNFEHLNTHHLYDVGYTKLQRDGATDTELNNYKEALRDQIVSADLSQYEIYVSDNMKDENKDYIVNYDSKKRKDKKIERHGYLYKITDANKIKQVQNYIQMALDNKAYAPDSYHNLEIGFSDVPNIGIGNYVKVPVEDEVYTVFIKTNKGVDGMEGGLNDWQRQYLTSPEYYYGRQVDELSIGKKPWPRTLNIGSTNTYKMGYIADNEYEGNYYIQKDGTYINLTKEDMKSLLMIRDGFKQLSKQIVLLPDDVEKELKRAATSSSYDGDMTLLQPYTELLYNISAFAESAGTLLSGYTGENLETVKRNIINDILNHY